MLLEFPGVHQGSPGSAGSNAVKASKDSAKLRSPGGRRFGRCGGKKSSRHGGFNVKKHLNNVNPGLINPKRLFNWEGTI